MRAKTCLRLILLFITPLVHAQLQQPYVDPTGTVTAITFTIPAPLAAGVTATVDIFAKCPPAAGASLLKTGIRNTATAAGNLTVLLDTPLPPGSQICATETFAAVGVAAPPAPIAPMPAVVAVMPAAAPAPKAALILPVIEAIAKSNPPFVIVDPVIPPAGPASTIDIFASCTAGPPAAGVGASLLTPGQVTTVTAKADPIVLLLKQPVTAAALCAIQTTPAAVPATIASVPVNVPAAVIPPATLSLTFTDAKTLQVADSAANGTTISLYTLSSPYACSTSAPAKSLALAVPAANVLTANKATLTLAAPLPANTVFCATDSTGTKSAAYVYLTKTQPVFKKIPAVNSTSIQLLATTSDSAAGAAAGWITNVQLFQLLTSGDTCDTAHGTLIPLSAGAATTSMPTDSTGSVAFTLASPLTTGSYVCAIQKTTFGNGVQSLPPLDPPAPTASITQPVTSLTDWGLVRAYFTGGIVLANDNSNFSSAYEFLGLNVDKSWMLPHCSGCNLSPASAPVGGTNQTTVIEVASGEKYELTGDHLKVGGAKYSPGNLIPETPATALNISGTDLSLQQTVGGAAATGTKLAFKSSAAVTVTGAGTITHTANSISFLGGLIVLSKKDSRGGESTITITGPATITLSDPAASPVNIAHNYIFGINSFFDARLTAIPVASNPTNTTVTGNAGTPTATTTSFLSTQKTARISVGVYLPVLLTHWVWNADANALFIAPISKIGFDTITQSAQQNVVLPDGTAGTQTYAQVYKYWTYGARIGHMQMAKSANQAPETYSYLDIGFGPYSNLESLICKRTEYTASLTATPPGTPLPGNYPATNYTDSDCTSAYPGYYQPPAGASFVYLPYETLKRIYRLDLEGLLKIPYTPIYVGFNANIGQKAVGAGQFDPAFKAPDDLRFFFGTRFDISSLISKLLVNVGN